MGTVRHCMYKRVIVSFLFGIAIGCSHFNLFAKNDSPTFNENVNLALRRTAHQLLIQNGDSTTSIPPVQQLDANTFVVKMNQLFEYNKLPETLQHSLDIYGLKRKYTVAITDCKNGVIQLGYNFLDLKQPGGVPCAKRTQLAGCYYLKVTFDSTGSPTQASTSWWIIPFGGLLVGLGFIVWKRAKRTTVTVEHRETITENPKIVFGNSQLDMPNLILKSANDTYNLTYREAKLLNLFVVGKNQILERDFILKSVWEDEGIVVGRSVDVFVSRLRKMLINDPQVKIAAVHGIGYRMEVVS